MSCFPVLLQKNPRASTLLSRTRVIPVLPKNLVDALISSSVQKLI